MALPAVSPARIEEALDRFDREERALPKWQNWEANKSFKFAIVNNGRLYPVKEIVAQATGVPTTEFSGGSEANRYVEKLGFKIEALRLPPESEVLAALHDLLLARAPSRVEPTEAFRLLADYFELPGRLRSTPMDEFQREPFGKTACEVSRDASWSTQASSIRLNMANGVSSCARIPVIWIEKTLVQGRPDRAEGPHAFGRALWSPLRAQNDADILSEHASGPAKRHCTPPH